VRNYRTGLFNSTRFRNWSRQSQLKLVIALLGDSGHFNPVMLTHLVKGIVLQAAFLTATVQPLVQDFPCLPEEILQASAVSNDSVVVVVSSQLRIQPLEELPQPPVAILTNPFFEGS
jgi:hypothetical protein